MEVVMQFQSAEDSADFFRGVNKAFEITSKETIKGYENAYKVNFEIRRAGGRKLQFDDTDINLMRSMRNEHGMTYTEIAQRFGTSRQTIMNYLKKGD